MEQQIHHTVNKRIQNKNKIKSRHVQIDHSFQCSINNILMFDSASGHQHLIFALPPPTSTSITKYGTFMQLIATTAIVSRENCNKKVRGWDIFKLLKTFQLTKISSLTKAKWLKPINITKIPIYFMSNEYIYLFKVIW